MTRPSPVERPPQVDDRYIRSSGYLTSSPVTARPISIRWISDVPSKIVKILECMGRVIGIPARGFRSPCAWGYRCPFRCRARVPAAQVTARYAC